MSDKEKPVTDWHRLSIRTDDGSAVEALGWWFGNGGAWVLDRVVDHSSIAYDHDVTDLGPADVLVLPAPSGPVKKHTWGWECGNVEATDLADADGWVAELPQHIADSRAIAAHIRGLGEVTEVPEPQVWLDPQPVVPRPEGGETEVEWSVETPVGSPHERLTCVDEQDAHDTVRLPSDRVQSRVITTGPWRDA